MWPNLSHYSKIQSCYKIRDPIKLSSKKQSPVLSILVSCFEGHLLSLLFFFLHYSWVISTISMITTVTHKLLIFVHLSVFITPFLLYSLYISNMYLTFPLGYTAVTPNKMFQTKLLSSLPLKTFFLVLLSSS